MLEGFLVLSLIFWTDTPYVPRQIVKGSLDCTDCLDTVCTCCARPDVFQNVSSMDMLYGLNPSTATVSAMQVAQTPAKASITLAIIMQ